MNIEKKVKEILKELPSGVELVAATKTRSIEEINQAIKAWYEKEQLIGKQ